MENKQDKGFTLVELLIVIVILGILATVTVFAVRGITDRGQENACSVEKRTLDTAIEAYYAQNQTDPTQLSDLIGGNSPLLKSDPSANWDFVAGSPASFTAVAAADGGKC
jgi:prepilin-type N-terminal cleavage/methylation domain-containing protein